MDNGNKTTAAEKKNKNSVKHCWSKSNARTIAGTLASP